MVLEYHLRGHKAHQTQDKLMLHHLSHRLKIRLREEDTLKRALLKVIKYKWIRSKYSTLYKYKNPPFIGDERGLFEKAQT